MNRELYFTLLLFAATLLAIWGFILVLSPFLAAIAWALCLAAVTFPVYRRLRAAWRKPRLAALVMVILTALLILVPLGFVMALAGEEFVEYASTGLARSFAVLKEQVPGFYESIDRQLAELKLVEGGVEGLTKRLAAVAPQVLTGPLAGAALDVLGGLFTAIMGLILMLATQYFVYTEAPRLSDWVRGLVPLRDEDIDRVFTTLRTTTSGAVLGGLAVALFQGFLAGIGYAIAGVQAPILWGLVTAFFSLLPIGGSAIVWGPMVVYLAVIGEYGTVAFLLPWSMLLVSGSDNIVRPWLLRRTGTHVHPMLLFFAILSGIGLFGMGGIVFGPLLIAFLVTLTQIYREFMARNKAATEAAQAEAERQAQAAAPPAEAAEEPTEQAKPGKTRTTTKKSKAKPKRKKKPS